MNSGDMFSRSTPRQVHNHVLNNNAVCLYRQDVLPYKRSLYDVFPSLGTSLRQQHPI